MTRTILKTAAAAACVGSLLGTGVVIGQEGQSDSTFTVSPRQITSAGEPSPADFLGVRGARRGQPVPAGHVAVGHVVTMTRGQTATYATFTLRCTAGTRLRAIGVREGDRVLPQIVGPTPFVRRRTFEYRGRASFGVVMSFNSRTTRVGETVTGTIHGLCR